MGRPFAHLEVVLEARTAKLHLRHLVRGRKGNADQLGRVGGRVRLRAGLGSLLPPYGIGRLLLLVLGLLLLALARLLDVLVLWLLLLLRQRNPG